MDIGLIYELETADDSDEGVKRCFRECIEQVKLADHQYRQQRLEGEGRLKMPPSEYFHRQVYVSTWFEHFWLEAREGIGVGNILWECDYPHPTGTFPHTRQFLERSFAGIPDEDRRRVLVENPTALFHLS